MTKDEIKESELFAKKVYDLAYTTTSKPGIAIIALINVIVNLTERQITKKNGRSNREEMLRLINEVYDNYESEKVGN